MYFFASDFFVSNDALLGNFQTDSNFNTVIPNFLPCVLQTLDKSAYVERMKGKLIIEVIFLRQENEGKFWFIRSCPFKKPATSIKIHSASELSNRDVIIVFKKTITTMQG